MHDTDGKNKTRVTCNMTHPFGRILKLGFSTRGSRTGYADRCRLCNRLEEKFPSHYFRCVCPLTLLEPQSRSGDNPVKFQVVLSPNGTAVLKGLRHVSEETGSEIRPTGCVILRVVRNGYRYEFDIEQKSSSIRTIPTNQTKSRSERYVRYVGI